MYLDYLDLPNKILGSGIPWGSNPLWGPGPPKAVWGVLGPIEDGTLRPQIFLESLNSPNTYIIHKLGG